MNCFVKVVHVDNVCLSASTLLSCSDTSGCSSDNCESRDPRPPRRFSSWRGEKEPWTGILLLWRQDDSIETKPWVFPFETSCEPVYASLSQVWVNSPHNASGYYTIYGEESLQADHFNTKLSFGDPQTLWARTGYLGFVKRTELLDASGGK